MIEIRHLNLILGDQLNHDSELWQAFDPQQDKVWMAEVSGESTAPLSSAQRTVLFLAAMRHFAQALRQSGIEPLYLPLTAGLATLEDALSQTLEQYQPQQVRCVLPGDYRLCQTLQQCCEARGVPLQWLPDNHFIARRGEFSRWLGNYKQPRMECWYRYLRSSRKILLDDQDKPLGGRWNFDRENRRSFSRQGPDPLPEPLLFQGGELLAEVKRDVAACLPELPGSLKQFNWPLNRPQALEALAHFIHYRLPRFGDYQDAMWSGQAQLYHACISTSLNLKLLNPREVIAAAEQAYHRGDAPLNSVEGFVRQVLGWREYIRGLYWQHRERWLEMNALKAQADLPAFYWDGQTEMHCMQQSIQQVMERGYGHHIQRLMVTGLFALLWGTEPKQIHQWYLAMYADALPWVEVPNTLGMSQYADGGIVGSKPYIASGAYIARMSDYCRHCRFNPKKGSGANACPFTSLYWDFVDQHQDLLANNPRLAMQLGHWLRKPDSEREAIRLRARELRQDPRLLSGHST